MRLDGDNGEGMTVLIPGQNVVISTHSAYQLTMDVSESAWGVVVVKRHTGATHLSAEQGLARVDNQLLINFHDIDDDVEKLVVYVHSTTSNNLVAAIQADLSEMLSDTVQVSVCLPESQRSEKALTLLEIYKHAGGWKVRCVCQGFSEGLPKLLAHHGLHESAATTIPTAVPAEQTVNISKLEDASITMVWDASEGSGYRPENLYVGEDFKLVSDFRIGCLYQLRNGQSGIVHSFDSESNGSFDGVPYVQASRSADKHFEQLTINQRYSHKLHRYLIFAFMVEGYNHWKAHNLQIDFQLGGLQSQILSPDSLIVKPVHAVAMLTFEQGAVTISPLKEYFDNLQEVDSAYGWGLPWRETD